MRLLCCVAMVTQMTSCELLDFDVDGDFSKIAAEMALNFDTIYVMQGDTVALVPSFKPDTLNIRDIFVTSSDTGVVSVNLLNGRIEAVGTGWTTLYVESVSARLKDSCTVYVTDRWDAAPEDYPYETVFYANVTYGGKPLTEDMRVAAYIGNECCGVGESLSFHGVSLTLLRVRNGSLTDDNPNLPGDPDDPDDPDDPPVVFKPQISFYLYNKKTFWLYRHPVTVDFDGETHGTLSNLYKIEF